MNTIPEITVFGQDRIDEVLELICDRELNRITCAETGTQYATIDDDEIRLCLEMEVGISPFITIDELIESWSMRHYIVCSGLAPSIRFHKDRNTMLRLSKGQDGKAKVLCYLAGRLFFEALIPSRLIKSTEIRRARLTWATQFRRRIDNLPAKWHESLTADDESMKTADAAVNILSMAAKLKPSAESEGKAAQLCLEALLRLDAIHNLRHSFYNVQLRNSLIAFRDSENWTFWQFRKLLDSIEADGIIKLQGQKSPTIGNSMAISMALDALNWSRRRHGISKEKFLENFEQGRSGDKFESIGVGMSGNALLNSIKELMNTGQPLSKQNKRELESALRDLQRDINSVSPADKRLEAVRRDVAKYGIQSGVVTKIAGDTVTKHLAQSYADHNIPLPAPLQAKFESITRDSKARKAITKSPSKSSQRLAQKYDIAALDDKIFNNIGLNLAKLNSKPDNSGKKE